MEHKRARRGELERDQKDPDGAGVAAWIPEDGGSFLGEDGELWERGGEERPEDEGWLGGEEEVDDGLDDWVDPVEEVEWRQAEEDLGAEVGRRIEEEEEEEWWEDRVEVVGGDACWRCG